MATLYEYQSTHNMTPSDKIYGTHLSCQTFTPQTSHCCNRINVYFCRNSSFGGGGFLRAEIWSTDGVGKPDTQLAAGDYKAHGIIGSCPTDWPITFPLGCGVWVEAGTKYAIVFRSPTSTSSYCCKWRQNSGGGYANGQNGYSDDDGVNWTMGSYDRAFWDYFDENYIEAPTVETIGAANLLATSFEGIGTAVGCGTGYGVDEIGFDYGTSPGVYDDEVTEELDPEGGFEGEFRLLIENLDPEANYYYRAKAHNAKGWGYGDEMDLTTLLPYPHVTTRVPTEVDEENATLNGEITDTGGDATCEERGFVYDTESHGNPGTDTSPADSNYANYTSESGSFGTGTFDRSLTGLAARNVYYFRAWAKNSYGYKYGFEMAFFTCYEINWLFPSGNSSIGIRFDSSPGGFTPNGGTIPHFSLVGGEDAEYVEDEVFGHFTGNYVFETHWYNSLMKTDLYTLSNPTTREEGIIKIKWKAKVGRTSYAYGKYQRELKTHSTQYSGSEDDLITGMEWQCEVLYANPNTGEDWTVDELDALLGGVSLGKSSNSWSRPMCDCIRIEALWVNAEVRTDAADYIGESQVRLNGFVVEDEAEECEVYFEWGETDEYGNSTTPQTKARGDTFSADVTPGGAIHYRAVIETACGETFYGDDEEWGGEEEEDGIHGWLIDDEDEIEITDPEYQDNAGLVNVRTEIGWDEELQEATAGICQIVGNNRNGDYSPENVDGLFYGYLRLGVHVSIYEIYKGTRYDHFYGKIYDIEPHPEHDNRFCYILAVDGMDDLNEIEINTVLRTGTEVGELADDVLDAAAWDAGERDIDTGSDTLQLGWFHKIKALEALRLLEAIENGRFYISNVGKATFESRHARLLGDALISQGDFEDTMSEMAYKWSKKLVRNQITVRGRRYYLGSGLLGGYDMAEVEDALIWSAHTGDTAAPFIPQGKSLTLWAEFDTALYSYDALVEGTHWNANTEPDKSGDDVSTDISLVQTQYGQSVKLVFTNSGSAGAFLVEPDSPPTGAPEDRTVLVYGTLYGEEEMAITEEDSTSQEAYGKRSMEIDARFKSNPNDILEQAQYMKLKYKDPVPRAVSVKLIARKDYPDDTIRLQCLERFISDRITLKSTLLGFDQDYFINKVIQEYILLEAGMVHETTWIAERVYGAYEGTFWLLGVTGYSELGETTFLSF